MSRPPRSRSEDSDEGLVHWSMVQAGAGADAQDRCRRDGGSGAFRHGLDGQAPLPGRRIAQRLGSETNRSHGIRFPPPRRLSYRRSSRSCSGRGGRGFINCPMVQITLAPLAGAGSIVFDAWLPIKVPRARVPHRHGAFGFGAWTFIRCERSLRRINFTQSSENYPFVVKIYN